MNIESVVPVTALVKLELDNSVGSLTLSALVNIEELFVHDATSVIDWKELPKKLINLQRIDLCKAEWDDIFVFVSRAAELNTIKIQDLTNFERNNHVLDLVAFNNERKRLKGAQKITIYLHEKICLATKWAKSETNLSLFQLKPFETD